LRPSFVCLWEGDSRQALLEGKPTTAMVELQTPEGFRRIYLQSFDDPRGCVILLIPNAVRAEAEETPPLGYPGRPYGKPLPDCDRNHERRDCLTDQ
jgi:hypothetical protein